jgi:hypothetical protein
MMRRAYGDAPHEGLPRDGLARTLEDTLVERAAVILRGGANATQQVEKKEKKEKKSVLLAR